MTRTLIRVAAGVVVHGDRVLLVRRHAPDVPEYDNKWELPAGKIESRENITAAAIREIREETGYDVDPIRMLPIDYQADLALRNPPLSVDVKCVMCTLPTGPAVSADPPPPPRSGSHEMCWARFHQIPYHDTIVGSREFLIWTANHLGHPMPPGASTYKITLESQDQKANRTRIYEIILRYDPAKGERPFCLELRAGRLLGSSRSTTLSFPTMADALQEARYRMRLRKRQGYSITSLEAGHPLRSWILSHGLAPDPQDIPRY
jgi:8-oxo-dGTP pyrophosphatase MutT (NUDIX family)